MSNDDALFEAAQDLSGSDSELRRISNLMVQEDQLARAKETQEALLADINERLTDLRHKQLPEAMVAAGVERFKCSATGTEARVTFECSGALGEDPEERDRKLDVLIANGADEIVKVEVIAAFGKDDYAKAMALAGELQRRNLPTILKRNIHPMTLKAWVKERMEEGADLPLDEIGLWYGQVAKIKRQKEN